MTFLLPLLMLAAPRAQVPWYDDSLVVDLHETTWDPLSRLQVLTARELSGRGASPLFRDPLAAAVTCYTLVDLTGEAPYVAEATMEVWKDTALLGASLGAEALVMEAIGRSDALSRVVQVARTFVSPNLHLTETSGGWRASVNEGDLVPRTSLRNQETVEGFTRAGPRRGEAWMGSGLRVYEQETPRGPVTRADATVWAQLDRPGRLGFSAEGHVSSGTWSATARRVAWPRYAVAANVGLASREEGAVPGNWSAGLTLPLKTLQDLSVNLRFRQQLPIPPETRDDWRVDLTLRHQPRNPTVTEPGRWPPGQRIGAPGPILPLSLIHI